MVQNKVARFLWTTLYIGLPAIVVYNNIFCRAMNVCWLFWMVLYYRCL